ncbi:MAG TPA: transcription termination factor NusA [Candidatus Moranbacteria bacterium]|nr:transcription termination factor NusA [Candidatus Moranbacteria bacterium]
MARRKKTTDDSQSGGKTADFGSAISQICEEKGISKDKVIETIEAALAAAYKKDYGRKGQNIRSEFDEMTGGAKFFLVKEVVDETLREFVLEEAEGEEKSKKEKKPAKKAEKKEEKVFEAENLDEEKLPRFNPERDLTLDEAKKIKKGAKVGDIIEKELEEKKDYGRVAAQTAKQVIIQRIREAERDAMYDEYKNREGEVVSGVVQRIEGRNVFIDLGKSVGVLLYGEQVERESYRTGQRIKVYVAKVDAGNKGPGITLSRTRPEMIQKLFELEVPEIFAGTVEIKAIAREAGERTKIAVSSKEEGIDPIGSCVGQKGTRVQAVIDELGGEKIDIILWNDDTSKFISAALSPAKVLNVEINEEQKEAKVTVPEDQLSLAIGKRGQNVRLAAKLTGWKIDILGIKADGNAVEKEGKETETETETESEEIKETEKKKEAVSEEVKKEKEVKEVEDAEE